MARDSQARESDRKRQLERQFVEEYEREHGYTPPPGLVGLVGISELMHEKAFGRKRPALTLIRGGRGDG
jgi:hypothetical protein